MSKGQFPGPCRLPHQNCYEQNPFSTCKIPKHVLNHLQNPLPPPAKAPKRAQGQSGLTLESSGVGTVAGQLATVAVSLGMDSGLPWHSRGDQQRCTGLNVWWALWGLFLFCSFADRRLTKAGNEGFTTLGSS